MPEDARPRDDADKPGGKLAPRLMLIAIFAITLLSIFGGQIFLGRGERNGDAPSTSTSTTSTTSDPDRR